MQGFSRLAGIVALALASGAFAQIPPDAEGRALLIGKWYGEFACENCGERDQLKWTRVNAADGNQRVHFRYYYQGKLQENVQRLGQWGYQNGIYWLTCEAYYVEGLPKPCPDTRYDFVVESLDSERMTYRSDKYGIRYSARRVPDDFEISD